MAAPKNNEFWKLRDKHGRDKLFKTPQSLLDSALEYLKWIQDSPFLIYEKTTTPKGEITKEVYKEKPPTKSGFFLFVGASDTWLTNFKKNANEDFLRVIEWIEKTIEDYQLQGASSNVFNAKIIASKLGLADKKEQIVTLRGKDLDEEWED